MSDLPTFQDMFRVARDEILSRNAALTRASIEREGTDANALAAGSAAVGDEVIGQLARVQGTLYLDSAFGTDLDRIIIDRYNLFRKPAAAAFTSLSWSTTAVNPAGFNIPAGSRVQTGDGRVWVTLVNANFPAASSGPVTIAARSASAGLAQQTNVGTITNIIDAPAGGASDLKVTNPLASAGADDVESDDDYKNRARQFFLTARRGTLVAIQNAALAIPGVRRASVFEIIDPQGRAARVVELVIADAFTDQLVGTTPTPAGYATQSQVLSAQIIAGLDEARAGGIFVNAFVAQVVMMPVQLVLSFAAGVDVDATAFQARSVIVAFVNSLSPGQTFSRVNAAIALQSVAGLVISGNEILSPVGNVVPRTLQVLRTNLSMVAAVSIQPDRALQGSTNPDGRV
jgi:hypothetical protein